jgi:hypothetical protein
MRLLVRNLADEPDPVVAEKRRAWIEDQLRTVLHDDKIVVDLVVPSDELRRRAVLEAMYYQDGQAKRADL